MIARPRGSALAGVEYHPPPNTNDAERDRLLRRIVGLPEDAEGTPPPNATSARLLACRVDALVVAFRLDRARLTSRLVDRIGVATRGPVELMLGKFCFALKAREQSSRAWFENADLRGTLDLHAAGGWHIEIVVRAAFLATHPLDQALTLVAQVADAFGHVLEGPRLRRVDLAADFVGFPLSEFDAERFATTRAALSEFREEVKDTDEVATSLDQPRLRIHRSSTRKVTGFTVSAGNPLSARIYDKTAELDAPGRDEKRAIEHALWEQHGWRGEGAVTRVEFQVRGEALDQFAMRKAIDVASMLDGLWQYGTKKWLRLIDPESATRRHRCALDERWIAAQNVCFVHEASPATRLRCRGGAKPVHALGASLSMLASRGQLDRVETGCDADGVVLDELGFVRGLREQDAEDWARDVAAELCGRTGVAAIEDLAAKSGWRNAALTLVTRVNAAVARFSSVDDRPGADRA